jgi:hypothetical protein
MRKKTPKILFVPLIAAALILPPLLVPSVIGVSGINRVHHEINVESGRLRVTRSIYWIPVSKNVEESPVSTLVFTKEDTNPTAAWCPVRSVSPGTRAPARTYPWTPAIAFLARSDDMWKTQKLDDEEKATAANEILQLWRDPRFTPNAMNYLLAWGGTRSANKAQK